MIKRLATYLWQHHLALLALFVVLGGTSYAAVNALPKNSVGSKQVINGSLQTLDLSKKAKKALKGNRGPRGFTGAQGARGVTGAQGVAGARGATGPAGPFPSGDVPSATTLRGGYELDDVASGGGQIAGFPVGFGFSISANTTAHVIAPGATPPAQCPGTAASPQAQPGHLCIYAVNQGNSTVVVINPVDNVSGSASRYGFGIWITSSAAGSFWSRGTWAVTAP
jgi:hypothetical protein